MQFTQLFDDDRAVSPVIGVILMVAITVILAAVIGTFVLGMSDQMGDDTPRASFGFDYDGQTTVVVSHESGDSITTDYLEIVGGDNSPVTWHSDDDGADTDLSQGDKVSAGDTATVTVSSGDTLRVVYSSPDSDSTTTLQKFEVPS